MLHSVTVNCDLNNRKIDVINDNINDFANALTSDLKSGKIDCNEVMNRKFIFQVDGDVYFKCIMKLVSSGRNHLVYCHECVNIDEDEFLDLVSELDLKQKHLV